MTDIVCWCDVTILNVIEQLTAKIVEELKKVGNVEVTLVLILYCVDSVIASGGSCPNLTTPDLKHAQSFL